MELRVRRWRAGNFSERWRGVEDIFFGGRKDVGG